MVARNAARLIANYPGINPAIVFGDFNGSLAGSGERLALTKPDEVVSTNGGFNVTNIIHIAVDEVAYRKGGRWGRWADGGGSSLELIDWNSDHRRAASWADSTETAKAEWSTIEWTGVMDNGNGVCDSFQLFLQAAGECLVDNVEVIPAGAGNSIGNPSFVTSATGWAFQGTHDATTWQATGGFGDNGGCLHVRAS